jgi:2-polyprenyl-3-methyl-5-hydroxy-6-metoxy-1,4-benzoquinol methylase
MIEKYIAQNARAWDEIAEIRQKERTKPASYFASGGSALNPLLVEAAGDLHGKSLLQLQCSTGEETISWAILGAQVTGVDISSKQIDLARKKAKEAGIVANFCVGDVCDLPEELTAGQFDLVHTGGGSLMWVPDIETWASSISSALCAGGRLLLLEEHPIAGCLFVSDGSLTLERDYFSRNTPNVGSGWRFGDTLDDVKSLPGTYLLTGTRSSS